MVQRKTGEDLYQRDPSTGHAVRNGCLNLMYPPIPEATRFQGESGYSYETPETVHGWMWSTTFNRWGARVTFKSGWSGLSWPEPPVVPQTMSCKLLRDAFFGEGRDAVFQAIPDLPAEAFGAKRPALLMPFAERLGLVPEGDLVVPEWATQIVYAAGEGVLPWDCRYTETQEALPTAAELGEWTIKEHVMTNCLIKGARYGVCWFRRFI